SVLHSLVGLVRPDAANPRRSGGHPHRHRPGRAPIRTPKWRQIRPGRFAGARLYGAVVVRFDRWSVSDGLHFESDPADGCGTASARAQSAHFVDLSVEPPCAYAARGGVPLVALSGSDPFGAFLTRRATGMVAA